MKYPQYRNELLEMLEQDQKEARAQGRKQWQAPKAVGTLKARKSFTEHCMRRAKRMLEILDEISEPSIENIGSDGSQAVSVLALHASLSTMKRVLRSFEESHKKDPASVYHEAIPPLTDRILLFERKKQKYGTQWMVGENGKTFLPPVEDFKNLNKRRAKFNLGAARHPRDLSFGMPEGIQPETKESDQRQPTQAEYDDYALDRLD